MKGPSMQDVITPTTTSGRGAAGAAMSEVGPTTGAVCSAWECEVDAEAIGAAILTGPAFIRKAGSRTCRSVLR